MSDLVFTLMYYLWRGCGAEPALERDSYLWHGSSKRIMMCVCVCVSVCVCVCVRACVCVCVS